MRIDNIISNEFTIAVLFEVMGVALLCGVILAAIYLFLGRKEGYSRNLSITLVLLPVIISFICLLVNKNWAVALTLAGAFSIIRFRTTQSNPKDLVLVFAGLAAGLGCGMGFILASIIETVFVSVILIVLSLIGFGSPRVPKMRLKITIPESLNYVGVFDEVFGKYANSWTLEKVKSSNFGTMFELSFQMSFKKGINQKEFLDELRTLNGNLNIMLQNYVYSTEN
jgi:hypothetical protein